MQLDQNLFRPGSTGSLLFASESRFGGAGFKGGFEIERGRPVRRATGATSGQTPRRGAGVPARHDGRRRLTARRRDPRRPCGPGWTTP